MKDLQPRADKGSRLEVFFFVMNGQSEEIVLKPRVRILKIGDAECMRMVALVRRPRV